jgi:hypothetical protein
MNAKSVTASILTLTLITLAAAPPVGAELVTVTVALIVAFAGTVAVTETVRHEQLKNDTTAAAQQATQDGPTAADTSKTASTTP